MVIRQIIREYPLPLGEHSSFTFMIVGVPTRIDLYNTT